MTFFNWRQLLSGAALVTLVAACSSTDEPDYAELAEFNQQVTPRVAWSVNLGEGTDEYLSRLRPVYADGIVYAADRHGRVSAVNAETGRQVWRTDLSPAGSFSLAVWRKGPAAKLSGGITLANNRVYVGSEEGQMYALDAATGELDWQVNVPGEVVSAPAYGEGFLVTHLGNGTVYAMDAETGEQRWTHEEEVPTLSLRGTSSPAIAAGGVMLGSNSGRAVVLILESGQLAWDERIATPTGSSDLERMVDIDADPVVRGDTLYLLAFNGELVAMHLVSGDVLWRRDYQGYRTPQITTTRIYLTTTQSHVVELERMGGTERWRNNTLYGRSLTEVAVMPDHLVTADRFGVLHWLDRNTGQIVGRHELRKDGVQVAPLRVDDKIIVQTNNGRLIALTY